MKIKNVPGEFGFKALRHTFNDKWILSEDYFFDLEKAQENCGLNVKWPVEIDENGSIYIPDTSEYE